MRQIIAAEARQSIWHSPTEMCRPTIQLSCAAVVARTRLGLNCIKICLLWRATGSMLARAHVTTRRRLFPAMGEASGLGHDRDRDTHSCACGVGEATGLIELELTADAGGTSLNPLEN